LKLQQTQCISRVGVQLDFTQSYISVLAALNGPVVTVKTVNVYISINYSKTNNCDLLRTCATDVAIYRNK